MRRKHSLIDKLPATIKDTVDEMIRAGFTYREIVEYINSTGNNISLASVGRYASNLQESIQRLRMSQENLRLFMEEQERHPNLDATDGIMCILSNRLLEVINSDEDNKTAELDVMIKNSVSLARAVAYKKNVELKNKDILQTGFEQVRDMLFEAMAAERPELYKEVSDFFESKRDSLNANGKE